DALPCDNLLIGDFEDVESFLHDSDVIISNFHAERIAINHKKALLLRGFPDFESLGNQLKNDFLYEGSSYLLFELANLINHHNLGVSHEH
ncbi:nitrogenase iron-molybdenum cofactor biosynthesis protein NifN, partial [bacterium]|nr:nitrogenase iron-molybdenum cofactor biosynthesis protein NifN [bacterium]